MRGIVQGVGFRPFVYNYAQKLALSGHVLNSSSGVFIEVEGTEAAIEQLLDALRHKAPPLAQIDDITVTDLPPEGGDSFSIRQSREMTGQFALIPSDIGTCDDCWRDFSDPNNRRYGYPFTNCTNCGPRYTIIRDIPYDRPKTTMACFPMCSLCQAEYEDPANRRFHAQPNACPVCGPGLALRQSGLVIPADKSFRPNSTLEVIRQARQLLREGKILAVKGLGGFLMACDAQNDETVRRLRQRKRRSDKPFALMARDLESVSEFCTVSEADRAALLNRRRAIVVLSRRPDAKTAVSAAVAPGNHTVGVMMPYTPLHYLLFSDAGNQPSEFPALVMTSGNFSEEPIVTSNREAWKRLQPVADSFLFHNRDIYMRTDDSVVRTFEGKERVLRRSRGYVPHPVHLGMETEDILACGAELKNTFCLTKGHYAFLSQHIGDLENYETLLFFEETLENLKKLFRVDPKAVAYDLHPQYMSSRFARALPLEWKIGVQHHHAHIASCMAENRLHGKVIGIAFDGTGYGTDGQIWGGEFLVADYGGFERRAHFRYVPLPGGDAAVRQPWRMALSYLIDTFGANGVPDLQLFQDVSGKNVALVKTMIARSINTVQTSSCGRMYDAVAALIGLRNEANFEGQAAIELEMAAMKTSGERYRFLIEPGEPLQVDMRPMIEDIVRDIRQSKTPSLIAASFQNTLAAAVVEVCSQSRRSDGLKSGTLNRVCLSGGTFQNVHLLESAARGLRDSGFEVFVHEKVPPNDGGISLGQAVIANQHLQKGD